MFTGNQATGQGISYVRAFLTLLPQSKAAKAFLD
jgi:hypothetical protein